MNNEGASNVEKYILRSSTGVYILNLSTCDCSILQYLLTPRLQYVWIRNHMPNPDVAWWLTPVPLAKYSSPIGATIRGLTYDLLMETSEFLAHLNEFKSYGLELYQSERAISNTLTLSNIPENQRTKILLANGIKSAFFLPHADEAAQFWTADYITVEMALQYRQVLNLAIPR